MGRIAKSRIAEQIEDATSELGITYSKVDPLKSEEIRKILAVRFTDEGDYPMRVSWENLKDFKSIRDSDGWKLFGDFAPEREVILFVDPSEEKIMWRFNNGIELSAVIGECYGFPFCFTSEEADYIICFDDHDCLMAAGTARPWLEQLIQERKLPDK